MPPKLIHTSFFGKLFGKYSKVEYDEYQLHLFIKEKLDKSFNWSDATSFVKITSGLFGSTLEFTFDSTLLKINFLLKPDCKNNVIIINEIISLVIDKRIQDKKELFAKYTQVEYLRDSNVSTLENELLPLLTSYNHQHNHWEDSLPEKSIEFLNKCSKYLALPFIKDFITFQYLIIAKKNKK